MNAAEAQDDLYGMLWSAWQAMDLSAVGVTSMPRLLWDDEEAPPPDETAPYARASIRNAGESQVAFGGANGGRLFEARGVVIVQCFGPRQDQGSAIALAMAMAAKDAYRGKHSPGGAWFTNCRTEDIGPDMGFWQVKAVAEFTYSEEQS